MPGGLGCTQCTSYNYACQTRCRVCRAANTATPEDWLCPRCGNSKCSRHTKCNKCHDPRPEHSGEAGRPRQVVPVALVTADAPELATTERRVLPVPYVPAPRRMTPRQSVYREEGERPQKRPKSAHQPELRDTIIPYPESQTHKAEQQQPRAPMTRNPEEVPREHVTLAERLKSVHSGPEGVRSDCDPLAERLKPAQSCPEKVGIYHGKMRSMAVQVD